MALLEKVLDKVLSARFLITIFIGMTYCWIVKHAVSFYLESQKASAENIESFATGLIMGFSGVATFIFKAYFDRTDRTDSAKSTVTEKPITEVKQ